MSWLHRLYETYERCSGHEPDGAERLMPISHTPQQAHIEIVIDAQGNFRRARVLSKVKTVMPATEASANRTSGEAPHPLADKVLYVAKDYPTFGGRKDSYFADYLSQLEAWCSAPSRHPKAQAVLAYVHKGSVVADLVREQVLVAEDGILLTHWRGAGPEPAIFRQLTAKKHGDDKVRDQGDALIRWIVESAPGDADADTWTDRSLHLAWESFYASLQTVRNACMVTGQGDALTASQHPSRLRNEADKAKLISSNDTTGYTFLGRFHNASEAASVSFEVTQKAHNALRWLIARQGYRHGEQVFVSWSVGGEPIPDPWQNTLELESNLGPIDASEPADTAQAFATRLRRSIAGYGSKLDPTADIVVMGLDSAGGMQGRLAIPYYRELKGSEFLERIESWHSKAAWHQNYGKARHFVGAPAPNEIAEATYGKRLDDKLRKATIERLLPCIVDGQQIPLDMVIAASRRASNRAGFKPIDRWEWEKCLGITCALFKGHYAERSYQMALEPERRTRDYLYGQLLAIAENIEQAALYVANESRDTSAARLMQRFADRPFSTWKSIELALAPYRSRLRAQRGGLLFRREELLDATMAKFDSDDFVNDAPLSGEFLLGYHCLRQSLRPPKLTGSGEEAAADADDQDQGTT